MAKIILITGGSASGKTTVANSIKEALGESAVLISQDNFYNEIGSPETNYDQPKAFDFKTQEETLKKLINDEPAELPIYNFETHSRDGSMIIEPQEYIIFEGLFSFDNKYLFENALFKIFVDTPSDTRLARRTLRDVNERNRKLEDILNRWIRDVQPSYRKYISHHKKNSDIIIPWTAINKKSIKAVISAVQHVDK